MEARRVPQVLAHRGVSVEFAENTLEAFAAAAYRGADGVELDVHRTADRQLAVHHDTRLADGRAIVDLRRNELPPQVPTLDDAIRACAGGTVNIEIKNIPGEPDFDDTGMVAATVVEVVRNMGVVDQVVVSSFNFDDIVQVRRLDADIATGWLVLDVPDIEAMLGHLVAGRHQAIHPPVESTTPELITAAHDRGIVVNVWTVDDPVRITTLAGAGADAVITNDPASARVALDHWRRAG